MHLISPIPPYRVPKKKSCICIIPCHSNSSQINLPLPCSFPAINHGYNREHLPGRNFERDHGIRSAGSQHPRTSPGSSLGGWRRGSGTPVPPDWFDPIGSNRLGEEQNGEIRCPVQRKHYWNSRNREKGEKSPESKQFTCSVSYFERLVNWISKEVRLAYVVKFRNFSWGKHTVVVHLMLEAMIIIYMD